MGIMFPQEPLYLPNMTMCSIRPLIAFVSFFGVASGFAQDVGYWQSQAALNYRLTENYSHNFSIENRNFILKDEEVVLEARQVDLNHFSALSIGNGQSLALGAKYRFREAFDGGDNELRFTQQYNMANRKHVMRFGHRVRSEQRIFNDRTVHRFRYRFAVDFPLQGEKLNIGEAYFVANTESLLSVASSSKPQFDQRWVAQIGWLLTEKAKLQIGLEYRFEDYAQETEEVIFLLSSLIFSL